MPASSAIRCTSLPRWGGATLPPSWPPRRRPARPVPAPVSAEPAHRTLLNEPGLKPLVDLGMRLGEASGAVVGALILRAAIACHTGMATFAEAGVSDKL